jgi:hypothetical protein
VRNSKLAAAASAARIARGKCRAVAIFAVAAVCLSTGATSARAQGLADRAERADRPALRGEIDAKAPSEKSADKDFTIGLDLPLRQASSVTSASVDSIVEDRPDRHVTPEVYLKWAHQYDWLKASAEVGASIDRYFKSGDANVDALHSSFKLARTDGKWEYFVPYASISNEMFFSPTFKQADITYNDGVVGFYSGIAWRDKTRIPYTDAFIPYSDATESGDVSIYFDARLGRRMSDSTTYQNSFASAKVTAAYIISDNWRVELTSSIRARWYGDYHGGKRTDLRPSASLGVVWSPDWLKKLVKRSELSFNLEYYRNYSNITDKNYSLWELGPTLSLRTKF